MHQNAPLPNKKIKKFPSPDPYPLGRGTPLPQPPPPGVFGASIGARRSRSFSFTTRTLRGIFPQAIFITFCLEEGAPGPHGRAKFQCRSFKTAAVRYQKQPKMVIFGKSLPIGKNSSGRQENLNIGSNLPVCNDTIIVLKIKLLHIVSVITNFVIPKREKKTNKTNKTRNQYASPTRQCNTGRPSAEAILTKSCVVQGFQKRC